MQEFSVNKAGGMIAKILLKKYDDTEKALNAAEKAVETLEHVKGDNLR